MKKHELSLQYMRRRYDMARRAIKGESIESIAASYEISYCRARDLIAKVQEKMYYAKGDNPKFNFIDVFPNIKRLRKNEEMALKLMNLAKQREILKLKKRWGIRN